MAHRRNLLLAAGLAALFGIVYLFVGTVAGRPTSTGASTPTPVLVADAAPGTDTTGLRVLDGVEQHGIAVGSPTAPVTLVEFADLQCRGCRQVALGITPQLIDRYVRAGKLRLVFRNLAFVGPASLKAGRMAAAAADQDKLWHFTHLFFLSAGEENTGYVTDQFLRQVVAAIPGLDVSRAFNHYARPESVRSVRQAAAMAREMAVHATPSFLIGPTNGKLVPFNPPIDNVEAFTSDIERVLAGQSPKGSPRQTASCTAATTCESR